MEDKKTWTREVGELLKKDKRSYLEECEYYKEHDTEIVKLVFKDGDAVRINVSCNSLSAILHEIVREVYGDGAYGRITEEWW